MTAADLAPPGPPPDRTAAPTPRRTNGGTVNRPTHLDLNPSHHAIAATLRRAADLAPTLDPDPEDCIRAAVYGRPDVVLPFWDTAESLMVEDACYWLRQHINPGIDDVDYMDDLDEWAPGRSIADIRGALYATAAVVLAGAR